MSFLPSKYSGLGLSEEDQKKVITTGHRTSAIGNRVSSFSERVNEAYQSYNSNENNNHITGDDDGDIPMVGMDDDEEVLAITEFLSKKRNEELKYLHKNSNNTLNELINNPQTTVLDSNSTESYLVVDTNFIISHLDIIDLLSKLHENYHHKLIIPTTTMQELDGLKRSEKTANESIDGTTVGHLARWANDWIYKKLAESDSSVRAQKLYEYIDQSTQKDDSILDCCIYLERNEKALVVLLSNDKNLCMKALSNDILTVSFRKNMSAKLIAETIHQERQSREFRKTSNSELSKKSTPESYQGQDQGQGNTQFSLPSSQLRNIQEYQNQNDTREMLQDSGNFIRERLPPPEELILPKRTRSPGRAVSQKQSNPHLITVEGLDDAIEIIYSEVTKVVLGSIDYCMSEEYGDDLELIGYDKTHVITLNDCSNIIIRHWVSVFTEYFQKPGFTPFPRRGKKLPLHTRKPVSGMESVDFIRYWKNILKRLYMKRDKTQNLALEKLFDRWDHLLKPFA